MRKIKSDELDEWAVHEMSDHGDRRKARNEVCRGVSGLGRLYATVGSGLTF